MRRFRTRLSARILSATLSFVMAAGPVLSGASFAHAEEPAFGLGGLAAAETATSPPQVIRELTERRTENARHYLLSDGTVRAEIRSSRTSVRDSAGAWQNIDTSLISVPGEDAVCTHASPVAAEFRSQARGARAARLKGDGWTLEMELLGAAEGVRLAAGSKVRYAGVARDTDLEYECLVDGLKETLFLSSAEAPSTFCFDMRLDGLQARQAPGGDVALYKPGMSEPTLRIGELVVCDSSTNDAGEPAYCTNPTMTIEAVPGGAVATYEIPVEWLADPARVFPVMVDPTLSTYASDDTYVNAKKATTSYGSASTFLCGQATGATGWKRGFVKFDVSSIPTSSLVESATYSVYQDQHSTTGGAKTYLARVTTAWTESSTWNSLGCTVGNPLALGSYVASQNLSSDTWYDWDVKSTVADWVGGVSANRGFMHYQLEEAGSGDMLHHFRSSEYAGVGSDPQLTVTYTTPSPPVGGVVSQDTTWTVANSPYRVTSSITVTQGVRLTIEPGVVVKFEGSQGLTVNGQLVADATTEAPVVFTSIKDDEFGGDTNGDATATSACIAGLVAAHPSVNRVQRRAGQLPHSLRGQRRDRFRRGSEDHWARGRRDQLDHRTQWSPRHLPWNVEQTERARVGGTGEHGERGARAGGDNDARHGMGRLRPVPRTGLHRASGEVAYHR